MREIKFRAWDNVDKKMVQVHNLCFDSGSSIYNDGKLVCMMGKDGCLYPRHRTELMQFTGLKDKNGREIYEGDIIKSPEYTWPDGNYHPEEIGDVYWEDSTARFTSSVGGQFIPNSECEIIGNIHENPELITPTTNENKGTI